MPLNNPIYTYFTTYFVFFNLQCDIFTVFLNEKGIERDELAMEKRPLPCCCLLRKRKRGGGGDGETVRKRVEKGSAGTENSADAAGASADRTLPAPADLLRAGHGRHRSERLPYFCPDVQSRRRFLPEDGG